MIKVIGVRRFDVGRDGCCFFFSPGGQRLIAPSNEQGGLIERSMVLLSVTTAGSSRNKVKGPIFRSHCGWRTWKVEIVAQEEIFFF